MGQKIRIGKVAKATGLTPKAIRYYEGKGLLPTRPRSESGYRQYEEADIQRLLFIRRAKELGISLRQIASIVSLWPGDSCAMTRPVLTQVLNERIGELNAQIDLFKDLRIKLEEELVELGRRPYSDHTNGSCTCLGDLSQLIPIEGTGTDHPQVLSLGKEK